MIARPTVNIARAIRRAILAEARRSRPRECCGLLLGRGRQVVAAVPMRNVARGTTRYRLDDAEHIAVRKVIREIAPAMQIVGVYHSHPAGAARPSETDLAHAFYPTWIHLIVGLRPRAEVRAFFLRRGRITAARIDWR